jgi:hypothetical protein
MACWQAWDLWSKFWQLYFVFRNFDVSGVKRPPRHGASRCGVVIDAFARLPRNAGVLALAALGRPGGAIRGFAETRQPAAQ